MCLEPSARVLVRRSAAAPSPGVATGGGSPAAAGSSSAAAGAGGGRRKPQVVRRLPEGSAPPRDVGGSGDGAAGGSSSGGGEPAAAGGGADEPEDDSDGDDAPAGGKKRKAAVDPLALTLKAEAERQKKSKGGGSGGNGGGNGGGGNGGGASAAPAVKVKGRSPEQIAIDYYTSTGTALGAAVSFGGGSTGDFLSEHGMIEHRVAAIKSGRYEVAVHPPRGKGKSAVATITASFKAVRKQVSETVQLLSRDDLVAFSRALLLRGSSRSRGSNAHLLKLEPMAARSPAVLWSCAVAFGGDVSGGIEALLAEAVAAE